MGPCLWVLEDPIDVDTNIRLQIIRKGNLVFEGATALSKMKRSLQELADFLFLETSFPNGAMLMTGTGVVPPDEFTLAVDDQIEITIDGIGTLINTVNKKH